MLIRPMTIDDYEEVYSLWMSCKGMGLNNLDDSKEGIEKFLIHNPNTCFVAEENCIVGAIMVGNDGRRGYIYHTAVNPKYQNQKIGTPIAWEYGIAPLSSITGTIEINKTTTYFNIKSPILFLK